MSNHEIKSRLPLTKFVLLILVLFFTAATPVCSHANTVLDEGLEGAVYLEETVGDLDKAIEAYKKVIQASKKQIAVAAEAQFRIGKCYALKGMAAKAEAAFEAVVDHYPQQDKWVDLAKSQLKAEQKLLPIPWGDGDELQLEMKMANGRPVGCQVYRIQKSTHDGQPAWECDAWQTVTLNNQHVKGQRVTLTTKEYRLLELFVASPHRALTRTEIMNRVWGRSVIVSFRSVDRCVATLRSKIEANPAQPNFIHTIRDVGYRFEPSDEDR